MQNPIPETTREKNNGGYDADSGLDILVPVGTVCFAAADGQVIYAEHGHTPWTTPPDTPNSILIKLDEPIGKYNFIWYTHLSELLIHVPDGSDGLHIKQGTPIGKTGIGNGVPHLHFGIVVDRAQTETMPQAQIADLIWNYAHSEVPKPDKLHVWWHDGKLAINQDGKEVFRTSMKNVGSGHLEL